VLLWIRWKRTCRAEIVTESGVDSIASMLHSIRMRWVTPLLSSSSWESSLPAIFGWAY
jgi:hypothetical protein